MTTQIQAPIAFTTRTTFSRQTSITIDVKASAGTVWNLLTNAVNYPKWNSTVISIGGRIEPGQKIMLKSVLDPKRVFKLTVKEFQPNSASTDDWATTINQTATAERWGGSTSARAVFNNNYVRTNGSAAGNNGFANPNVALEYAYTEGSPSNETSLWNVTGTPYGLTQDGIHPNSFGHARAAAGMVAYRNGVLVSDPFAQ